MTAPPESSDRAPLPPWLRGADGRPRPPEGARENGDFARGLLAGVLLAGALGGGVFLWWRTKQVTAPPVACPPAQVCPEAAPCPAVEHAGLAPIAAPPVDKARPARHVLVRPTQPATSPLPPDAVPEDARRRDDLRAFAAAHASDLKACVPTPNRGPVRRVGAALVIDAAGHVAAVQILGPNSDPNAAACYAERLRRWKFPASLLRGQERLLVNFVL